MRNIPSPHWYHQRSDDQHLFWEGLVCHVTASFTSVYISDQHTTKVLYFVRILEITPDQTFCSPLGYTFYALRFNKGWHVSYTVRYYLEQCIRNSNSDGFVSMLHGIYERLWCRLLPCICSNWVVTLLKKFNNQQCSFRYGYALSYTYEYSPSR